MKEATMIFRPGDSEVIWGIRLDTKVVDAHEVEEHLADGWYRHPFEARDAAAAAASDDNGGEPAQNVAETETTSLEERARAAGLVIDGRWSPDTLAKKVEEAEEAAKSQE